jgi:uncharacterized protein (DUF1330 family)
MKAYIIVDVSVTNAKIYEGYKKLTPDSLKPFGGKFVVRGGAVEVIEGNWNPQRIVVLEFPSRENAQAWWSSSEYAPAKSLRQSAATTNMIMVEGSDDGSV